MLVVLAFWFSLPFSLHQNKPPYTNLANLMAPSIVFLILVSSFFIPTHTHLQSSDEAFTSLVISQKGIDFLKDLLVSEAISSIISLKLPQIEKSKEISFLGNVEMVLSNITIYEINVGSSFVKLGDEGIAVIASETTCNLSMSWYYAYNNAWIFPFVVSDTGEASVKVWIYYTPRNSDKYTYFMEIFYSLFKYMQLGSVYLIWFIHFFIMVYFILISICINFSS